MIKKVFYSIILCSRLLSNDHDPEKELDSIIDLLRNYK